MSPSPEIDPERPETWPASAREYLARHRPAPPDTRLRDALREEIHADGPFPFAQFMERALYDPEYGYYASGGARIGAAGDFVTAPTLHPAFGALLWRRIVALWEQLGWPEPFIVAEAGAGTGALAEQVLSAADGRDGPVSGTFGSALRYRLIEPFAPSRAVQVERLRRWVGRVSWLTGLEEQPDPPHLLLANELLDALPVHRVVRRGSELRELYVALDERGELVEQEGPLSTAELDAHFECLGLRPPAGVVVEVSLAALRWLERALATTRGGWIWLLDYGAEADQLYSAPRAGTLRAFHSHALSADWLDRIGGQDLTADVDFTSLIRAAEEAGWRVQELITQRDLLLSLGLKEYLRPPNCGEARLDGAPPSPGRWSLLQLIDPHGLGAVRSLLLRDGRQTGAGRE
jgi:SAM-dependent MidA family methyltransferase